MLGNMASQKIRGNKVEVFGKENFKKNFLIVQGCSNCSEESKIQSITRESFPKH